MTILFVMSSATFDDRPHYRAPALSALRDLLVNGLARLLEGLLTGSDHEAAFLGVACVRELSPQLSETDLVRLMEMVIERPALAKEAAVMWLLAGTQDDRWYRILASAGGERLLSSLQVSEEAERIARSLLAGRNGL